MNKIEKLIKKYCPDGVEYRKLGDIWNKAPKSKLGVAKIKELPIGDVICFTSGNNFYFIDKSLIDGEYLFMNDDGQADIKYHKEQAYYTDHVFAFTTNDMIVKFLYYYLKNNQQYVDEKLFKGVGLKNLDKKILKKSKYLYPPYCYTRRDS